MIELQAPTHPRGQFKDRDDLARAFCPGAVCCEVGVLFGSFSNIILQQRPAHLYLVDPWKQMPDALYPGPANLPDVDMEAAYRGVGARLGTRPDVTLIRAWSYDAARDIQDGSLGLCHIDACHNLPMVLVDCITWWPKLARGGVLLLHDYNLGALPGLPALQVAEALRYFLWMLHREKLDFVTDSQDSAGLRK